MKILTGQELLTKIQNNEDISNIYFLNKKDMKGTTGQMKSGRGYFTLKTVKGNLCVDSIFNSELVFFDLSE